MRHDNFDLPRLRLNLMALGVTGLRNPCSQIEAFKVGLLAAVLARTPDGSLVRKAGVMAIVIQGGLVESGTELAILSVPTSFKALQPV